MNRELAVALAARRAKAKADPLAVFAWASRIHRAVCEWFAKGVEVGHRAGNYSGKTYNFAHVIVAIARMERELAGVLLPRFSEPPVIAVLVPSYKQAIDSSNKAVRLALGDWPHDIGWVNKALGYIGTISVKPNGWHSDDKETWSRIVFVSQDANEPDSVKGQRWDVAWGDEPPKEGYWREARKNARYRALTFTPLSIDEWEWIQKDFDGCLNTPSGGRIELTTSLFDNSFITDEHKQSLVDGYKNDDFIDARIRGDYVDVSGATPWSKAGYARLQVLQGRVLDGELIDVDLPGLPIPAQVRVWDKPRPGHHYIASWDLSEGIEDGRAAHDPSRGDIICRETGRHVLEYQGYLDPFYCGLLAAHLGEGWNDAHIDYDSTGGYGRPFAQGLEQYRSMRYPHGYRTVVRDVDAERFGSIAASTGYKQTSALRNESISAVREWLLLPGEEGVKRFDTRSRTVLDSLLRVRMVKTPSGTWKIQSRGRDHDEALFTTGRLIVLNRDLPWPRQPKDRTSGVRATIKRMFGADLLDDRRTDHRPIDNFGSR